MSIEQTRNLADEQLTRAVLASFQGSTTERFLEITETLVRHLHDFVEEVKLSEQEWRIGIDFLTRTGHITDDKRQEFILLSDALGVSMLVVGINNRKPPGATPATVFGPFFVEGSPPLRTGTISAAARPGSRASCRDVFYPLAVRRSRARGSRCGRPTKHGFYDVQYDDLDGPRARGHVFSEEDGRWWFWSVRPEPYPIPVDGPVGDLLGPANRSPMRPAHVHFKVSADGYETLITHVFVADDPYLDSDAVFGAKNELITEFSLCEPGTAPDRTQRDAPYYTMSYDLVLAPAG